MTIITKPVSEKKLNEKGEVLVDGVQINMPPVEPTAPTSEAQEEAAAMLFLHGRNRVSKSSPLCLLFVTLLVISFSIFGVVWLYQNFAQNELHRYRGWCEIPYDKDQISLTSQLVADNDALNTEDSNSNDMIKDLDDVPMLADDSSLFDLLNKRFDLFSNAVSPKVPRHEQFFKEEFELDLDSDSYEKIDVPDFHGAQRGRFVHDFNANKSCIIDLTNQRCFVMPLNRNAVLPPKSLYDLIHKMWGGFYDINTDVVRETMRVITPALTDPEELGPYIAKECQGMDWYKLEKVNSTRTKRSLETASTSNFINFAGGDIMEYKIQNLEDIPKKQ